MLKDFQTVFIKSLFPFTGSLFLLWMNGHLHNYLTALARQEGYSKIYMEDENQMKTLSSKSIQRKQNIANTICEAYLQFMVLAILLEITVLTIQCIKKRFQHKYRQSAISSKELSDRNAPFNQGIVCMLTKVLLYIVKLGLLYSSCFLIDFIIYITLYFACNFHTQKKQIPSPSMQNNGKNLKDRFTSPSVQDEPDYFNFVPQNERILSSLLTPVFVNPLFSNDSSRIYDIIFSADSRTAFILTENDGSQLVLVILNISNKSSPTSLSTTTFSEDRIIAFMILSSDEATIYLALGDILQILDISNLNSPIVLNSLSCEETNCYYASFVLSSDSKTLFLVSQTYIQYSIEVVNVTLPSSPTKILTKEAGYYPGYEDNNVEVYIKEDILYIITWNVIQQYDILDLTNPNWIANCTISYDANPSEGSIMSIALSPDLNFAYQWLADMNSNISIYNITDIAKPAYITTITLGLSFDLTISPDGRHIFITDGASYLLVYDVSNIATPIAMSDRNMESPGSIFISPNGRTAFLLSSPQLSFVEFYFNLELSNTFSMQNPMLQTMQLSSKLLTSIAFSPDGSTLYVENSDNIIDFFDVSNPSSMTLFLDPMIPFASDSSDTEGATPDIGSLIVSPNGTILFISGVNNFGTNNPETFITTFNTATEEPTPIPNMIFSEPSNIISFKISFERSAAFILINYGATAWGGNLLVMNISNITKPTVISNTTLADTTYNSITLSPDSQALFIASTVLYIYDISDLSSPKLMSTFDNFYQSIVETVVSPDQSTLFAFIYISYSQNCITIINITSLSAPTLISSMSVSSSQFIFNNVPSVTQKQELSFSSTIAISKDGKTIYLAAGGMTVVDVSVPEFPNQVGYYSSSNPYFISISPDETTAFLADNNIGIISLSLKAEFVMTISPNTFYLGTTSFTVINLYTKNSENTYDATPFECKFIGFSSYDIVPEPPIQSSMLPMIPQIFYEDLPVWVDFDAQRGIFTFNPTLQSQIGPLNILVTFSRQINSSAFYGIGHINSSQACLDLMENLLIWGYVDNEEFLTASFDPNQGITLSSQYATYASNISIVLANYYFKVTSPVYVLPSLNLSLGSNIVVNTPSLYSINLNISLGTEVENVRAKFVDITYLPTPSFGSNQSTIDAVGSLLDINTLLSQLVIFLDTLEYCNGTITITDSLNSPLVQSITNISSYFAISSPPTLNTVYFFSQINKVSIKTDEQFIIQFDPSTFFDSNGQSLRLNLSMQDSNTLVPDWLIVKGFSISGTPPNQLTDREIALVGIISNQFQSTPINFTLNIGISLAYALQLILSYLGALITVLGLMVYASKIYNVLFKNVYRYPKDFIVTVGQEITAETIYPIAFISEELAESKLILNHINEKIQKEIGRTNKTETKEKMPAYFVDSDTHQVDNKKLMQVIGEVITEIKRNNPDKLKLCSLRVNSRKKRIDKLITNDITLNLLNTEREKATKKVFLGIKANIFDFTTFDGCSEDGICNFSVNKDRLDQIIQTQTKKQIIEFSLEMILQKSERTTDLNTSQDSTMILSNGIVSQQKTITKDLILDESLSTDSEPNINRNLLIDAIEAYAFKIHNLDVEAADIEIEVRKQSSISVFKWIKEFLKYDLQLIGFSKAGQYSIYGINYEVRKGVLKFYGVPDSDIANKKLVVQIMNQRKRILRELWISGIEIDLEKELLLNQENSEQEIL